MEREINNELIQEIVDQLRSSNQAMKYGAFNYDGSTYKDLPDNIIESTGVSDTLLIEVRNNNFLINKLIGGKQ